MTVTDKKHEVKRHMEIEHFLNSLRVWYVLFFVLLLLFVNKYLVCFSDQDDLCEYAMLFISLPFLCEYLLLFISLSLMYSIYCFLRPVTVSLNKHLLLNVDYFDFIFAGGIIYFTGGLTGGFLGVFIFPLVISLVRFGIIGGYIGAMMIVITLLPMIFIVPDKIVPVSFFLQVLADIGVLFFVFLVVAFLVKKDQLLRENIYRYSITDALTGIYNVAYFRERVEENLLDYQYDDNRFAIIFIDLNNFKKINDDYGHLIGDKVLTHIAEILSKNIRSQDILARYGGDEFVLFLPETNKEVAVKLAQRLKQEVNDNPYVWDKKIIPLDFSTGVAIYPDDGYNLKEMTKTADQRMYEQKKKDKKQAKASEARGDGSCLL